MLSVGIHEQFGCLAPFRGGGRTAQRFSIAENCLAEAIQRGFDIAAHLEELVELRRAEHAAHER